MQVVWSYPGDALLTVRDVYRTFAEQRPDKPRVYATVETVMYRLAREKHLLIEVETLRKRRGLSNLFLASMDRADFLAQTVRHIASTLGATAADRAHASTSLTQP